MTRAEQQARRRQWQQWIAEYTASGLGAREWCASYGVNPHRLWYWLRRFTALGATDLRKSIDGLAALVKESFHLDPFSRSLFFAVEDDYYRIVDDPERTISTRKGNSKSSKSRRLMPLCPTNMQVRFTHYRYSY